MWGLLAICILAWFVSPRFLSIPFLLILLRQAAVLGIVALGQTFCVVNRSLDLSVGATIALVNIVITDRYWSDTHAAIIILVGLAVGTAIGVLNGLLVTFLRASAVVITLGTASVLTGVGYLVSGGAPGNAVHPFIKWLGRGRFETIPVSGIIWLAFAIVGFIILRKLVVGRHIYAVGDNPSAARYSGIPTNKVLLFSHIFCGFSAGLAGILLTGLIGVGALNLGSDYILSSIAAVILGGAVFGGGAGGAIGSVFGAALLIMTMNLLTVFGIDQPGKLIVQGLVIVIAAGLYQHSSKTATT
ncbi:MAG: ABC transporter permease [Rhodobacteraceae bacterium]|nr:ABC transporter permease [Paracoccaceae bacterium]